MSDSIKKRRVMFYVDGFNLYFGMLEAGLSDLKWLNIMGLCSSFMSADQELVGVKYFTSNIKNDPPKEKRQRTFLSAIEHTGVRIIRGKYEDKDVECGDCGKIWQRSNEKMTDVNIATQLILDAIDDRYDLAILITGDSDIVPAINIVNNRYSPKFVSVFFPPHRSNVSVQDAAHGWQVLGRKRLKDYQLPDTIELEDGFVIEKPTAWVI
jgi:hypothetical protein